MIEAKVIADSINEHETRLITFQVTAPKFIDAELRTHRMLSQNSSSDRAIPFSKMKTKSFYVPEDVRKNQKGMQGYEKITDQQLVDFQQDLDMILDGTILNLSHWENIIHKQHLNRYLLGYSMQSKVITGTEWKNFFNLRLAADAQPEIQEVARMMKEAMDASTPQRLKIGEWHLPYVEDPTKTIQNTYNLEEAIKMSAARCARVSYGNHDGTDPDVEKDLKLYDFLVSSGHLSPLEHQATPMQMMEFDTINDVSPTTWEKGVSHIDVNFALWSGTFKDWIQYRKMVE